MGPADGSVDEMITGGPDWFDQHAGALQAGGSFILVLITAYYARLTRNLAASSQAAVTQAREQVKVAQTELQTAQEQLRIDREMLETTRVSAADQQRLQREANDLATRTAGEALRSRLVATSPIITVEATGGPIYISGGAGSMGNVTEMEFYTTRYRIIVNFKVINHGPGPALFELFDSPFGTSQIGSQSGQPAVVVAAGGSIDALWAYEAVGAELVQTRATQPLGPIRFRTSAVAYTGVWDLHSWIGELTGQHRWQHLPSRGDTHARSSACHAGTAIPSGHLTRSNQGNPRLAHGSTLLGLGRPARHG